MRSKDLVSGLYKQAEPSEAADLKHSLKRVQPRLHNSEGVWKVEKTCHSERS
jgi:hypothetical protein